jgi:peptidoglycan-N-acetylglucosamine deacetylase
MLRLINNPPPWPNGARCAVCFSFDFDAESLLHLYYPDDSTRRISLSSTLRYGARVAVPRIVEIWKHFGVKQTMFVPGWCVETYPKPIELLLRDDHEIAHHGWLHERPNQLSRQDEERVLKKGMEIIASVTGKRVAGYRCPSGAYSEYTLDLLIDNGFVYDASLAFISTSPISRTRPVPSTMTISGKCSPPGIWIPCLRTGTFVRVR